MIKKLRKKFVLTAMLSVITVLTLIMGVINTVNYISVAQRAKSRIELILSGDAQLDLPPAFRMNGDGRQPDGPRQGFAGFNTDRFSFSEETPFESRYFTVTVSKDSQVVSCDLGMIAAVDEEKASALALRLFSAGKTEGFAQNYRYVSVEDGSDTSYIFLDCTRELNTFFSFLYASVLVSALGVLLIFILVIFLSKAAVRPMAESYEKQKRFITDASHDLKTPLAVISADAEVLELTSGENEWTDSIKNQVKRLSSLTEKLVMLSRMDEEAYKPVMADFDMSAAVSETAASFESIAVSRSKNYAADIEPGVKMYGEENLIKQLCSILLDNAMKYSDDGGTIRISLKKNGKNRELTVFNTADNVKKGNNDILFERFYRSDESRTSSTGGHGIGLSVAQAIVSAHKGRISAHSADGESIEFKCIF